jgi:hypothetical protein
MWRTYGRPKLSDHQHLAVDLICQNSIQTIVEILGMYTSTITLIRLITSARCANNFLIFCFLHAENVNFPV